MSPLGKDVQELLAVIHRDGGHHTAKVGIVQSIKDAEAHVVSLREAMEEFCIRVESGEVRSVYTYNKFKELLDPK